MTLGNGSYRLGPSLWCIPSIEISSTCMLGAAGAGAAAIAVPGIADRAHAAAPALAARHAKDFRLVTGTPVRADLLGVPKFLSRQGEIRVLARRTQGEAMEATRRFLATSREFGAASVAVSSGEPPRPSPGRPR